MLLRGRRATAAVALAATAVLLAGCTPAASMPTPTPTPSYTSDYETPAPVVLAPLTGLPVDDAASLAHPSLAAKIDNHWDARPQVGLEQTDLVFEELVEGGLTRYVAVWHSHVPAEIGPIRSIRPMDPDIISPFGGIVAYSGGQYRFVQLMRSTNVYNAIHGQADTDAVMYRTSSKAAPHNVIVKAPELIAMHPDLAPPTQQYSFADEASGATAAREGTPIAGVDLVFGGSSHPSWRWDAASARWLRSQDAVADTDSNGAQLAAVNVVVVRVGVSNDGGVPKTELVGAGEAWVLSGGAMVHASWSKADRTSPIRLVDDTGTVIRLAPGNSWFELVPHSGSITTVPAA
ncbi:DUF3048 domain-containing protein [Protaetiibacter mangrovi]|uniref:DUF3048 domain-containing protein n=1 Tax=Protaetiibacter mangrovi TaxID=2970926 RepID=A0ABT1ZDQ1_9MICO|nr:DUF3048 domain-containing protein [Protaetiibacter mangrovi]MCS0498814.1 DUF3048 domain-containing protein [Protaetiibacter mangrovi]TPW91416.1 DUF3048 domain-containing protein [Schumannella luteola]